MAGENSCTLFSNPTPAVIKALFKPNDYKMQKEMEEVKVKVEAGCGWRLVRT